MKRYNITVNGTVYDVTVEEADGAAVSAPVSAAAPAPKKTAPKAAPAGAAGNVKIECPMPGTVMEVKLKVGDKVVNGTPIVVIEAMKMENEVPATCEGTIASINVSKGDTVETGTLIATINA